MTKMLYLMRLLNYDINPALLIIDVQNGFVSKGGSYDLLGIDTSIFSGIDTSICVEASLRDAFNLGYDVVLIADATISNNKKHYESTIDNIKDYYGLVMDSSEFSRYLPQH